MSVKLKMTKYLNTGNAFLNHALDHHRKWDFGIFALLTILSLLNGRTTVFYLIYFFWWNELLRIIVDKIAYRRNPNAVLADNRKTGIFESFIQMGVYLVFIVVFFGFLANWNNTVLIMINMEVLFFRNPFFNLNLIFVVIERVYLHKTKQPLKVNFGSFTPNMLVLHVSILLGAILMFFVVRNFPDIFTPANLWGSVIIILPFLLLKYAISRFETSGHENR